jgi:arylformamidase
MDQSNEIMPAAAEIMANLKKLKVYDISLTLDTNMPNWPGHPSMAIVRDARNFEQNGYFAQTLIMSEHTGSHVDAPAHAVRTMPDATIDKEPADMLIAPYKKYDLISYDYKAGDALDLQTVKVVEKRDGFSLEPEDVVLLQFGWDKYFRPEAGMNERMWWATNSPGITEEVAKYFSEAKIRAIGSDSLGCDAPYKDGIDLAPSVGHDKYFLPKGIYIMESLGRLRDAPTTGIFLAIPLKIKGGSGSPIRPILLA